MGEWENSRELMITVYLAICIHKVLKAIVLLLIIEIKYYKIIIVKTFYS